MRTILIPTDFTIESLHTVRGALKHHEGEPVNLILVYGAYLSNSITDLLFFSKTKHLAALQSQKFTEACEILKNKYDSHIDTLAVDLFSGYNHRAFENFLAGNEVDELFIPSSYQLKKGKDGFDLLPYFRKSSLPLTEVEWRETALVPEENHLAGLFLVSEPI